LNPFDLFGECVANVDDSHIARMELLSVDRKLFWIGPAAWGNGLIEPTGKRTFQFNPDGKPACIVPVCRDYSFDGFEGSISDVIAFHTDNPYRCWTLYDTEPVLNPEAVERAKPCLGADAVLQVHATPLEWLQNAREGCVILDWSGNLRFHLGGVQRIYAANPIFAKRLEKALILPTWPSPEIRCAEVQNVA